MMVLSGANITMFITFIHAILIYFPRRTREIIAISLTSIFLGLIPMQPSISRAALMNFLPRIGAIFNKDTHKMYLLLLSCSLILCFDIQIMYNISFQLSFMAILGILLFYKDGKIINTNTSIVLNIKRTIAQQILLGLSAQVFTAPLIFYYFGNISILGIFTSLILAPLISPLMVCTLALVSIPNTHTFFTDAIVAILKLQLNIIISMIHVLSKLTMFYIQY